MKFFQGSIRSSFSYISSFFICTLIIFSTVIANSASDLHNVTIYGMGGTIAGNFESGTDGHYHPGKVSIENLLSLMPELSSIANVEAFNVERDWSARLSYTDQIKPLAEELYLKLILDPNKSETFIVTMGTDTMAQVAFAVNTLLHDTLLKTDNKTLIFLGAMKPMTINQGTELNPESYGAHNILSAVKLGASGSLAGSGTYIVMGENILMVPAVKVNTRVSNTPFAGRFSELEVGTLNLENQSPNGPVQGKVLSPLKGQFNFDGNFPEQLANVITLKQQMNLFSNTTIGNNSPVSIEQLLIEKIESGNHDISAIILEGAGEGTSTHWGVKLAEVALNNGVAIVRASEVARGYAYDDEQPGVGAGFLSASDANWLLAIGLANTSKSDRIAKTKELMTPYQVEEGLTE